MGTSATPTEELLKHSNTSPEREAVMEDRANSTTNHQPTSEVKSPEMAPLTTPEKEKDEEAQTIEKGKEEAENSAGSEHEEEEEEEEARKEEEGLSEEQKLILKRRREKRLALNRASARERRKRKRLLIEELQDKNQQLATSNLTLRRANEDLRTQVAHLTNLLSSTQPGLGSMFGAAGVGGDHFSAAGLLDPLSGAASSRLTSDAGAFAALQQQERVRALLEAQEARMALAAQMNLPTPASVGSASELGLLQQRQHAFLAQQLALERAEAAGLGGATSDNNASSLLMRMDAEDQELLRAVAGGHGRPYATDRSASSQISQHALSAPVSNLRTSNHVPLLDNAGLNSHDSQAQRGRTALDVLQLTRRTSDTAAEKLLPWLSTSSNGDEPVARSKKKKKHA